MMPMAGRAYLMLCLIVFLIALSLRVGLTWRFVGLDAPPDLEANPDQLDYELFAYRLSTGRGYTLESGQPTARRAPGTSLTLLPVYAVFGRSYAVGRLWFCLMSALTCLVVGWVAWQCFGPTAGLLAAAGLAFYPGHFYYSMHFVSETPYGFWLALALALTVRSMARTSLGWSLAAGVAWGMAVLTRPQIIIALPLALVVTLVAWRSSRGRPLVQWAAHACVVLATVSPWVVRNAVLLDKPSLATIGGLGFWGSNNAMVLEDPALRGGWVKHSVLAKQLRPLPPGEVDRDARAWQYGIGFVRENALAMPGLCAAKLRRLVWPFSDTPNIAVRWAFALGWIAVAPFLAAGAIWAWGQSRQASIVLWLPIVATVLVTMVFYGSDRFRDSCAPAFMPLACYGMIRTWRTVLGQRQIVDPPQDAPAVGSGCAGVSQSPSLLGKPT